MPEPDLSLVIPTYNEKENVKRLIPQVIDLFKGLSYEVLVVDDDSPDGTGRAVEVFTERGYPVRLVTKKNKEGIGAALRVGYDLCQGKVIASTDADLSFDPADLLRMYQEIQNGSDLVTGNRHANKSLYETPNFSIRVKHWVSLNGNRVLRLVTGIPLEDFSANFRMIRREVWENIHTEEKTNTILFEMILKSWIKGYQVKNIPVTFKDRRYGKSKLRLSLEAPKFLIKLMSYLGRYSSQLSSRRRGL